MCTHKALLCAMHILEELLRRDGSLESDSMPEASFTSSLAYNMQAQ